MNCGFCFGCMEQISSYPCPKCGYRPGTGSLSYALQPGTILKGRYLVGKVLGQGGFGITYIGIDLQLQRKVAIKEYFPSSCACRKDRTGRVEWYSNATAQEMRQTGQEMVLKEARKMGKVSHIMEIVHVYDMFQENDTAYICMDFIQGVTLMDHLKTRGPLSWEEAKRIFLPAMEAMEQVHQAGLVHRDISPDNIMLRSAGGIRILDMGAAKDLNVNSGKSSMQVAKSGFSPPEQYMQTGSSGSWTDVYAMAATLYFALTGKLPLPAMDRMNPEGDALDWEHPQLLALPRNVLKAMKRAMELRIIDRTQTMAEFAQELQTNNKSIPEFTFELEQQVEFASDFETVGKTTKQKPRWVLPAVAAVAVLVVALCIPLGRNNTQTEPPEESTTAQTEDPVYQTVVEHCTQLREAGEILDALQYIEDQILQNIGDERYIALRTEYKGYLMAEASAYAQSNQYLLSIRLMDDAWKQLGYSECHDAATEYRKEFGIYNTRNIAAGKYNTFIVQETNVSACGDEDYQELDANNWSGIIAVSAGDRHVVGLRDNGTVVAAGENQYGECDVGHWRNIVAITAGDCHTIGLQEDGTLVATGFDDRDQCQVSTLMSIAGDREIVSIAAGHRHTLALLEDGTVAVCGKPWSKRATEVAGWTDIAAIYAGTDFSAGLKTDGTVVICGSDTTGKKDLRREWNLSQWTDIVGLAAGDYYLVGLRADGTVVFTDGFETDKNAQEHEIMRSWRDVVQISAGRNHTVAVTKTGKILCAGSNGSGQCDFNGITIQ